MPLGVGDVFGARFRVEAVLGRGASGEVFRVVDLSTDGGPTRALKLLRADVAGDRAPLALHHEFALLARLRHPNLVAVHGFGTAPRPFLVAEHVDGPTLDVAMRGRAKADLLPLALDVVRALAYLHGNGTIHLDIKPANILVAPAAAGPGIGTAKVADLGIAALTGPVATSGEGAREALVAGTLPFISPERLRGAGADPRADLWALGITLYACALGRAPVQGTTTEEVLDQIETVRLPPLRDACPDAPVELERFVARLLALDPRDRYRDGADALAGLQRALGQSASLPPHVAPARLIGRGSESQVVRRALAGAAQPGPRLVWVVGGPGSGRTRLLDDCAIEAQLGGALAVAVPAGAGLAPWQRALRLLGGGASADSAAAMAEALDQRLARGPVLLVVDDLDQRDRLATEIVDRVGRTLATRSMRHLAGLVVAGQAPGVVDPSTTVVLELAPLDDDAITSLVDSALGAPATPELAAFVARAAGGAPAVAVAVLDQLLGADALRRAGGAWHLAAEVSGQPHLLRDRRVERLSAPARHLATVLAVFPGQVALDVVAACAEQPAEVLTVAVDELIAAQLIRLGRSGGRTTLGHRAEATRAACRDRLDAAARRGLADRAWRALRDHGEDEPLVLCPHALAAGHLDQAFALAQAAWQAARARGDQLGALAAAEVAVAACSPGPGARPSDDARARAAGIDLAWALIELGRLAEAALAIARWRTEVRPELLQVRARLAVTGADPGEGRAVLADLQALAATTTLPPALAGELALLELELARLLEGPGAALARGPVTLARLTDPAQRGRAHLVIGQAAIGVVETDRAEAELRAALALAEERDDPHGIIEATGWMAAVFDMRGDAATAMGFVDRGLREVPRTSASAGWARLLNIRGILHMWAGRLDQAAESLLEAERRARLVGQRRVASSASGNAVVVHRRQGLLGQAVAAAQRSLRWKDALGDRGGRLTTFANLIDVYAELGDLRVAEATARRGLRGSAGAGQARLHAVATLSLIGVLTEAGRLDEAHALWARGPGPVDEHNQIEADLVHGRLLRASGRGGEALVALGRAIDAARARGKQHEEVRALRERALVSAGGALVVDDLRRAAEVAAQSGARHEAWLCGALLGRTLYSHGHGSAGDRELARAHAFLREVEADLPARHRTRFRAHPTHAPLIALIEAAAPCVPLPAAPAAAAGIDADEVLTQPL